MTYLAARAQKTLIGAEIRESTSSDKRRTKLLDAMAGAVLAATVVVIGGGVGYAASNVEFGAHRSGDGEMARAALNIAVAGRGLSMR